MFTDVWVAGSAVPYELYLEQIRRFGREVLPQLQAHEVKRVPTAAERH